MVYRLVVQIYTCMDQLKIVQYPIGGMFIFYLYCINFILSLRRMAM